LPGWLCSGLVVLLLCFLYGYPELSSLFLVDSPCVRSCHTFLFFLVCQ
jgi:hypothetical protein